jgi:hypothetical protein
VPPAGIVEVRGLAAGQHEVAWTTPAGFARTSRGDAKPDHPR